MDATYKIAEHMTAAGPALGRPWHRGATTITNACMTTTRRLWSRSCLDPMPRLRGLPQSSVFSAASALILTFVLRGQAW